MAIDPLKLQYLEAMGIDVYEPRAESRVEREAKQAATVPVVEVVPDGLAEEASTRLADQAAAIVTAGVDCAELDWSALQQRVASCTACELHKARIQTVYGVGNPQAELMIIGEAPGAEEDKQGEPFVGRAGKLLNAILFSIGLQRQEVYIANILKCRPPNNRNPSAEEVLCCENYLKRQVALIQPRVMLAVGAVAAKNLLQSDKRIGELRGKRFEYGDTGIPLLATYHPAYLLRSPKEKRKVWEDLKFVKTLL